MISPRACEELKEARQVYSVKVYKKDCGELIVAEVDVEDSADPDMIRLVVYCHKPGT